MYDEEAVVTTAVFYLNLNTRMSITVVKLQQPLQGPTIPIIMLFLLSQGMAQPLIIIHLLPPHQPVQVLILLLLPHLLLQPWILLGLLMESLIATSALLLSLVPMI